MVTGALVGAMARMPARVPMAAAARRASVSVIGVGGSPSVTDLPLPGLLAWQPCEASNVADCAKPTMCCADEMRLYAPAAIQKGQVALQRHSAVVKFRLWKKGGFLHCHANAADYPLVLPVFMADGCGYPALSIILKTWMESGSTRWDVFRNYLSAAAERCGRDGVPHQSSAPLHADDVDCPSNASTSLMTNGLNGKKLDTRFNTEGVLREWVFVEKKNCS